MAGLGFVLKGVKRIFDDRAVYAQVVVTDNCNLSCGYCNEYIPGAPPVRWQPCKNALTSSMGWG